MSKGAARIYVCCDHPECGRCDDFFLTETAYGWDARYLDKEMESEGWIVVKGDDICPDCRWKYEHEAEERSPNYRQQACCATCRHSVREYNHDERRFIVWCVLHNKEVGRTRICDDFEEEQDE